jgi:CSLREA domain-containing protein
LVIETKKIIQTLRKNKMKNVIINTDNYYFERVETPGILKLDQLGTATSNRFASKLKRGVIGFNAVLLLFLFLTLTGGAANAATFTVNLTTDAADANPGDGICDAVTVVPGSQCTLRAAIEESNILPGVDDITFALGGANAINLTINQLWIKSSLNINGPVRVS